MSPAAQSTASLPVGSTLPLEVVVEYVLAAKRSLNSISSVWRANEIVTSARSALEDSVVLRSRTTFLQKNVKQQTRLLEEMRDEVSQLYEHGEQQFHHVLLGLDDANARLQKTMDLLRATMVEAAFRPEGEEPRNLLDFIDDASVESMREMLKSEIRDLQLTQAEFVKTIAVYDAELASITKSLRVPFESTSTTFSYTHFPAIFAELETNAAEMAELLQSLVNHFDLCVTAIRGTEGGLTAVREAIADPHQDTAATTLSEVIGEAPSDSTAIPAAMIDSHRAEMFDILVNDAAEIPSVMEEMRDRLAAMEESHDAILAHLVGTVSNHSSVLEAARLAEAAGLKLPFYAAAAHSFQLGWVEQRSTLDGKMQELEDMTQFYSGYIASYDSLILEVARRRSAQDKMRAVLKKTAEQIARLRASDVQERQHFRSDVGEWLPADLWEGLHDEGPSLEGLVAAIESLDGDLSGMPALDDAVLEAARARDAMQ